MRIVRAFTMAEVLITLGIIGIIAAMTLPALITNFRERQTVIRLKRAYSILQNVSDKMRSVNGDMDEWADDSLDFFANELFKNLSVIKKCEKAAHCSSGLAYTYPAAVLIDGMVVAPVLRNKNFSESLAVCKSSASEKTVLALHYQFCAKVLVDINGKVRPNRLGEDVFEFRFFTDGVLPNGINSNTGGNVAAENFETCLQNRGGQGTCTAWVLINENLDYLHCPDKIGWNKASSCSSK